jgi:hypothetical protein
VKIKKKAHLRSYEENARCTSLDEVWIILVQNLHWQISSRNFDAVNYLIFVSELWEVFILHRLQMWTEIIPTFFPSWLSYPYTFQCHHYFDDTKLFSGMQSWNRSW